MSKEAVGQCGEVVGSSGYWAKLNRGTLFADRVTRSPDYRAALTRFGHRAKDAIDEVYGDLSSLAQKIRYLPKDDRTTLAKQVEELYDICKMSGVFESHASDCIHGLNLSFMSPWNRDIRNERGIERALAAIKNFRFSNRTTLDLLLDAGRWGINSAAGRDEKKRAFLQSIADIDNSDRFFTAVAEEYQHQTDTPKYEGRCGYSVGSRAYRTYLEVLVFDRSISGLSTVDYAALLRDELSDIAQQLERDLDAAQRNRDYITDDTASILRSVVNDLDRCGVSTMGLTSKVDKLAWYVGGDPSKIRKLQHTLNSLDSSLHLKEDGIYGEETQRAWLKFLRELETGTVPTLCWTDLLQTAHSGIEIGATTAGKDVGLSNAFMMGSTPYIHFDPPHAGKTGFFRGTKKPLNYSHINLEKIPNSTDIYDWARARYNHYPLNDDAYKALSDLKGTTKKVRFGGKVLLVAGIALDALELGLAINSDLKDVDKKLGKPTVSTVASIGGSWAASALLAKAGALAGVATGPALAPFAIPILSLLGGIAGAIGGSRLAEYIVDITYVEE